MATATALQTNRQEKCEVCR